MENTKASKKLSKTGKSRKEISPKQSTTPKEEVDINKINIQAKKVKVSKKKRASTKLDADGKKKVGKPKTITKAKLKSGTCKASSNPIKKKSKAKHSVKKCVSAISTPTPKNETNVPECRSQVINKMDTFDPDASTGSELLPRRNFPECRSQVINKMDTFDPDASTGSELLPRLHFEETRFLKPEPGVPRPRHTHILAKFMSIITNSLSRGNTSSGVPALSGSDTLYGISSLITVYNPNEKQEHWDWSRPAHSFGCHTCRWDYLNADVER